MLVVPLHAESPCYAFLLKGDVSVVCAGSTTRITDRGDLDDFAVSDVNPTLAFAIRQNTGRAGSGAEAADITTLIDLRTGTRRQVAGENALVGTCGGIFRTTDPTRRRSGDIDLITGKNVRSPYQWFRCSADRSVFFGAAGLGSDLYSGSYSDRKAVAPGTALDMFNFNVSPDGSKVAYTRDAKPLCVSTRDGSRACTGGNVFSGDIPSVNNAGEVPVGSYTQAGCYYKSRADFQPPPKGREATDACLGVGYWKSGMSGLRVLEPLGRGPQWIDPATAKLLRAKPLRYLPHASRAGRYYFTPNS